MKNLIIAICVTIGLSFPAIAQDKASRAQTEKIIEEYILAHPEVIERSMKAYYDKMRKSSEESELQSLLRERKMVDPEDSPALGDKSAPITIVEFSDFQCPFCAKSVQTIKELRLKYGGQVRVVFKQFPLENHPAARPAALASVAASKQGKFWEYHDMLMSKQGEWSMAVDKESVFASYAGALGMDRERFLKDMRDESSGMLINRDIRQGAGLQVNTTPTFFINGVPLRGAYDISFFYKVIDYLLKEKS